MRSRNLIIALIFAGATASLLAQCITARAGDAGRQGEAGIDSRAGGGICGCLGNAPLADHPGGGGLYNDGGYSGGLGSGTTASGADY